MEHEDSRHRPFARRCGSSAPRVLGPGPLVLLTFALAGGCSESHEAIDGGEPDAPLVCTVDTDCSAAAPVCDLVSERCVACLRDRDCAAPAVCIGRACETPTPCDTSRTCAGLVCDLDRGYCVECVADRDCEPGDRCVDAACVPPPPRCDSDRDCSALRMLCDAALGECVECLADRDCPRGFACETTHRCADRRCAVDEDCADAAFCNGGERCDPSDAAADAFGCAPGAGDPFTAPDVCDEGTGACLRPCAIIVPDADADGYARLACGGDDCDDSATTVHPGAVEICNAGDDDCDANIDEGLPNITCGVGACARAAPACVDGAPGVCVPGAPDSEMCEGTFDENCDGRVDEGCSCTGGTVVITAMYWCVEDQLYSHPMGSPCAPDFSDCCVDGRITDPYYLGLPCPADVGIAHTVGWTGPCDGCIDGVVITNLGTSTSAAWRSDGVNRYCCDGNDVRRIPR